MPIKMTRSGNSDTITGAAVSLYYAEYIYVYKYMNKGKYVPPSLIFPEIGAMNQYNEP